MAASGQRRNAWHYTSIRHPADHKASLFRSPSVLSPSSDQPEAVVDPGWLKCICRSLPPTANISWTAGLELPNPTRLGNALGVIRAHWLRVEILHGRTLWRRLHPIFLMPTNIANACRCGEKFEPQPGKSRALNRAIASQKTMTRPPRPSLSCPFAPCSGSIATCRTEECQFNQEVLSSPTAGKRTFSCLHLLPNLMEVK